MPIDFVQDFSVFPKPTNVTGTIGTGGITLSWTDLALSETGYAIERRESVSGTGWQEIGITGANATSYVDNTIVCNTEYVYRVQTRRSTDEVRSGYSDEIIIDFDCSPMVDPDNLVATTVSGTHINLTWNDNNNVETSYKIERRISGSTFAEIASISANSTSFADTTIVCGTDYDYQVRAYRTFDNTYSGYTNIASSKIFCPLVAPSSLVVNSVIGQEQLDLTWIDNSPDETAFQIERLISGTWTEIESVVANATSYSDSPLSCYTAYDYRVIAFRSDDSAVSPASNIASGSTSCDTVYAPTNLTGTVNETNIDLVWKDNSPDETSFEIQRSISGANSWSTLSIESANNTTYSDLTTTCGGEHDYRVRAQRSGTASSFSNIFNIQQVCPPPSSPSGLTLTAPPFSNDIELEWLDNSTSETDFYIERSTDGSTDWTQIVTLSGNTVSYIDTDASLSCYTPYHYRVQAHRSDDGVSSTFSYSISISTGCDPDLLSDILNPISENLSTLDVSSIVGFPQPSCASSMNHVYVWEFPATGSDIFNLTTLGSSIDTVLSIWNFDGTNFYEISCNDDSNLDGTSALVSTFPLGSRYLVIVSGKNNAGGNITLNSAVIPPPTAVPPPPEPPVPTATPTPDLTTVGIFRDGIWLFRDSNTSGSADITIRFGTSFEDAIPLVGDWNGDGIDGIGLYENGSWYLREVAESGSSADYTFRYGIKETGWQPVVGDWNGDGIDGIGLYKNGTWMLKDTPASGDADYSFRFNISGSTDATAIAGDWHDEAVDRVGLYNNGRWFLSYDHSTSNNAKVFQFGPSDGLWKPIVGDWDEDGDDTIGVSKGTAWRLRNTNSRGNVDIGMTFGSEGAIAVAGYRGNAGVLALFASVPDFNEPKPISTATDEPYTMTPTQANVTDDSVASDPSVEYTEDPTVDAIDTPTLTLTETANITPTLTPSVTSTPIVIPTATDTPLPSSTPTQSPPTVWDNISGT
jgi:hypothetical protein